MTLEASSIHEATETVILIDERNRALGAGDKLETHRRGLLHRAFSVFLTAPDGRFLLQRRSAGKYHSGGLWGNSCCGHPRPGERTVAAARRRVREELGVDCAPRLRFVARYVSALDHGMTENELVLVYSAPLIGRPDPDPDEVADLAFRSVDEIEADIRRAPAKTVYWLRRYIETHGAQLRAMASDAVGTVGR